MKKFLKKKGTMIGSIIAASVMLVLLLVFCIRPVAVGFTYKKTDNDLTTKIQINSFSKLTMIAEQDGKEIDKEEGYYFVKDGLLIPIIAADKDSFKKQKEDIIENWDTLKDLYKDIKVNAFSMEMHGETLTCTGTIVTVVILAVVEVVLAGGAIASIVLRKKK